MSSNVAAAHKLTICRLVARGALYLDVVECTSFARNLHERTDKVLRGTDQSEAAKDYPISKLETFRVRSDPPILSIYSCGVMLCI